MVIPDEQPVSKEIRLTIENIGDGDVAQILDRNAYDFGPLDYLGVGDVKVRIPTLGGRIVFDGLISPNGVDSWDCTQTVSLGDIIYKECTNNNVIRMVGGKTATIVLEGIPIQAHGGNLMDELQYFEAQVDYQYCLLTDALKIRVR